MKFKAIAVVISTILLTGCLNGSNSSPSANQVSVTVQNANGNNISSVALTPNSTTVVKFHNNSNYSVANPTFTTNLPSGVTASGDCTGLVPQGDCTITLTSSNTATGAGSMSLSGDNIENNPISVPVAVTTGNVTFTPVSGATQPATLRGLKYQEVTLTNNTAYSVLLQNNDALSELSNLAIATDTAHTENTCLSSTTAAGGSCHFWVVANNGPDVGSQTANNLSFSYLVNGANIETQQTALNATVETDLYMAGGFDTTPTCRNGLLTGRCSDLAKWDGTQWNAVGGQMSFGDGNTKTAPVNDIVVDSNGNIDLFLGEPLTIQGISTNYLTSWDGTVWNNFNGGISSVSESTLLGVPSVPQLFAWDNTDPANPVLYFYYAETNLGGSPIWKLASWSPMANSGNGVLNADVYTFTFTNFQNPLNLAFTNGTLYAGYMTTGGIGGIQAASTSNLQSWTPLDTTAFDNPGAFTPYNTLIDNNILYTGGIFSLAASSSDTYLLATDNLVGSNPFNPEYQVPNTSPFGAQVPYSIFYPQLISNNGLYFTSQNFNGQAQLQIAPVDDINRSTLIGSDNNVFSQIYGPKAAIVTSGGTIYVAGAIDGMSSTTSGTNVSSSCIAKYTSGTWSSLTGTSDNNLDNATTASCNNGSLSIPFALVLTPTLSID